MPHYMCEREEQIGGHKVRIVWSLMCTGGTLDRNRAHAIPFWKIRGSWTPTYKTKGVELFAESIYFLGIVLGTILSLEFCCREIFGRS